MEVHEGDLHVLIGKNVVHHDEGVVRVSIQCEAPHGVDHPDGAEARLVHADAPAGALGRVVGRTQDAARPVEIVPDLRPRPGVVAQRDHVRPRVEDLLALRGGDADDVRVLSVHDRKIDVVRLPHPRHRAPQVLQSRLAADVAHGKDSYQHKRASFPIYFLLFYHIITGFRNGICADFCAN